MEFSNTYEDSGRAAAYDQLEWGGTYLLVFNWLTETLRQWSHGTKALDFGSGTGRSTRLLKALGFSPVGIDISEGMVSRARLRDAVGDYRVITDGDLSTVQDQRFDLILSAFTFDNIPTRERKVKLFRGLSELLQPAGSLINIVSTPEIYTHEWVTFTTRDFPENRKARCGDLVRIVTTDYTDNRPVDDILWPDEDYRSVYDEAGLQVIDVAAPLATGAEGVEWVTETRVAPWRIYTLGVARQ